MIATKYARFGSLLALAATVILISCSTQDYRDVAPKSGVAADSSATSGTDYMAGEFVKDLEYGIELVAVQMPPETQGASRSRRILVARRELSTMLFYRFAGLDTPELFEIETERPIRGIAPVDYVRILRGVGYRVPTVTEWNYFARWGSAPGATRYGDIDDIAWHRRNSGLRPSRSGMKLPNALGLYDVLGNVAELAVNDVDRAGFSALGGDFGDGTSLDRAHWDVCTFDSSFQVKKNARSLGVGIRPVVDVPTEPSPLFLSRFRRQAQR